MYTEDERNQYLIRTPKTEMKAEIPVGTESDGLFVRAPLSLGFLRTPPEQFA
jgi:hypothetical protein